MSNETMIRVIGWQRGGAIRLYTSWLWAWARGWLPGRAGLGHMAEGAGWALLAFSATWAIGAGLVTGFALAPMPTAAIVLGLVAWALACR